METYADVSCRLANFFSRGTMSRKLVIESRVNSGKKVGVVWKYSLCGLF